MADREVLVQRLTAEHEEFRRLRDEHHRHEEELAELQSRPHLAVEQQWRVSELKKLKLMAKDRMEMILREHGARAQTPA